MIERTGAPGDAGRGSRKPDRRKRSRPGRKRKPKPSTRRFAPGEWTAMRRAAANARAAELVPVLAGLQAEGITGAREVATALTERKVPTARGGAWHAKEVQRLSARIAALPLATRPVAAALDHPEPA